MKFFLKKTNLKKGVYLQIYQSEYRRGIGSRNRSYKAYGYVDDLKASGIKDPVAHVQAEVDRLNDGLRKQEAGERARKIGRVSPGKHIGYFALKGVANSLPLFEKAVRAISAARGFQYDVYDLMMALVYARATFPASKRKTHADILPQLFEDIGDESYSQVLSCCEYIGTEYRKIISFLTRSVGETYGIDTSRTYFDCTNFYFEIDVEDEFRKKGPSKENRHEPIVGMGLMLDSNQIPIAMKMYSGNESEKPRLRETVAELKKENSIKGKTIQIADKGLNCARNIHEAIRNGDGYLFSKSLKQMKDIDINWFLGLDSSTWKAVYEKDDEGNDVLKYRYYSYTETFEYEYEDDYGRKEKFTAKEKRVITFSPRLQMKKTLELNRTVEKARKLCLSQAKKDEFGECGKYIAFMAGNGSGKKAVPVVDEKAVEMDRKLAGYNMLVTSETSLRPSTIYGIYHNLWRIEQSFRMLKTYLEARPVYLSSFDSIRGHFLICYIGIVLERILEFNILGSRFSHERIMNFIRDFSVVRLNTKDYVNLLTSKDEVGQFLGSTILPEVTNYTITPSMISKLLKVKFKELILEPDSSV